MVFKFLRRTRSLTTPQLDTRNNQSSEILLYIVPNDEKLEILTSQKEQSSSDFLCCFDSCDFRVITTAFWIFLGFESEDEDQQDDAPQVIQTGLYRDKESTLDGLNRPPLLSSSSTSSTELNEIKLTKNVSRNHSLSNLVQKLSHKLSKNKKDEAKTDECSGSDHDLDDDTNPLPISYLDELPSFSYHVEDDGDHGVGITPKSSARKARYRLAALDAATQRDFCALHEMFFQSLFDEAKFRRIYTKTRSNESMLSVSDGSKNFDQPSDTIDAMAEQPTYDKTFQLSTEIEPQKTNLHRSYSLGEENPSIPRLELQSASNAFTRNNKVRRLFSVGSKKSVRDATSYRASWYRLRHKGISHRDDLIIAPTSDFHHHDETSYISEPSTCDETSSEGSHPEPVSPIFIDGHCRLQKDKYKGYKIGSQISAYGRDAVLRKLNEKIDLIAAIDLEDSRATLTRVAASRMPLASIRTSVISVDSQKEEWNIDPDEAFQWEKKDVVETRSMIGIRMGLLSIQYGLLIQWDVRTCTADLIVLRKMCSDDFLHKNNRLSRSVVSSHASSQETCLRKKVDEDVSNTFAAQTTTIPNTDKTTYSEPQKQEPSKNSSLVTDERDPLPLTDQQRRPENDFHFIKNSLTS